MNNAGFFTGFQVLITLFNLGKILIGTFPLNSFGYLVLVGDPRYPPFSRFDNEPQLISPAVIKKP